MAEIITRDSEEFKELAGWIKKAGKAVEEATARIRPTVADEHYMTGDEVCALLHISRRTLQTLRDERLVPYTTIGGKLLYPESSLYEVLKRITGISDGSENKQVSNKKRPSAYRLPDAFLLPYYMASL